MSFTYSCFSEELKMPTHNLLRLLKLLMWMRRIGFGSGFRSLGLVISLNFCSDFEHKVWSRFWSWSSGEILKLKFSQYLVLILGWVYEDYSWSRFWSYVRSRFLNFSLVEMLIFCWGFEVAAWTRLWRWMKSYQDLFENLWYDLKKLLW